MKKIIFSLVMLLVPLANNAEVRPGPNGVWYGNICFSQIGWEYVPWQPVGSMCWLPRYKVYGIILNR